VKISLYCDAHDSSHMDATIATFHRATATQALVMISGPNGWQMPEREAAQVCTRFRDENVDPIVVAFPPVDGDLRDARQHLRAVRIATGSRGQLDAEPRVVGHSTAGLPVLAHWHQGAVAYWRDDVDSITTTRAEAPHLGDHGLRVYAQLEQQNSTETLANALLVFGRYTDLANIVIVTGVFDQPGDPRTIAEERVDLDRCTAHAKLVGEHGAWSAHTLTPPKADALREWASSIGRP
jgi:hypothetical protein